MKLNLRLAFAFAIIFLLLTVLRTNSAVNALDDQLTLAIYNCFHNQTVTSILVLITDYAIATAVAVFLVALFIHIRHNLVTATTFLIISGVLYLGVEIMKSIIGRMRPFEVFNTVTYLGAQVPAGQSFPSAHSAVAFFAAYFITKTLKLKKWEMCVAYLLALLVAVSRIYLGAHFVLDTIAGAFLGMCVGELAMLLNDYLLRNK
jgi:undecaprenyl-diphosphatase